MFRYLPFLLLIACSPSPHEPPPVLVADTVAEVRDSVQPVLMTFDSLDVIASILAGEYRGGNKFPWITTNESYLAYVSETTPKWANFDTVRLKTLNRFARNELDNIVPSQKILFYPFSGPDILYPSVFFPAAQQFVLIGLEPIGSVPDLFAIQDSLGRFFNDLNNTLNAILKYSFFRTESMREDLRSSTIDGVIPVCMLFLKKTGHRLLSIKRFTIDSTGRKQFTPDTSMKKSGATKGVEFMYVNRAGEEKTMHYFSVNAADYFLSKNKGMVKYLVGLGEFNTYLKGASYLLHKATFALLRQIILAQSAAVIQDDSGIALRYFINDAHQWDFSLFGQYSKPIKMFQNRYQADLDSLYQSGNAKRLDFGIGYNYRDKNSNFMVAKKVK
jgi:hypothetical protein